MCYEASEKPTIASIIDNTKMCCSGTKEIILGKHIWPRQTSLRSHCPAIYHAFVRYLFYSGALKY